MKNKGYILFWSVILVGNIIIGSTTSWGIFSKIAVASNLYIIAVLYLNLCKEKAKKREKKKVLAKQISHKSCEYEAKTELRAV